MAKQDKPAKAPKQASASQDIARAVKSGDIPAEAAAGFRALGVFVDRSKGRRG